MREQPSAMQTLRQFYVYAVDADFDSDTTIDGRLAALVGLELAGGLAFFLGWTVRGVRLDGAVRRRLLRVLRGSAVVAVAAAAIAVPLSGAYQLGSGPGGLVEAAAVDLGGVQRVHRLRDPGVQPQVALVGHERDLRGERTRVHRSRSRFWSWL